MQYTNPKSKNLKQYIYTQTVEHFLPLLHGSIAPLNNCICY